MNEIAGNESHGHGEGVMIKMAYDEGIVGMNKGFSFLCMPRYGTT